MPEAVGSRRGHVPARPQPLGDRRAGAAAALVRTAAPVGVSPDDGAGDLLRLQRSAGNRAVSALLERAGPGMLQRVAVTDKKVSETLYNQPGAGGKAKAKDYGLTPKYVLTRNGD